MDARFFLLQTLAGRGRYGKNQQTGARPPREPPKGGFPPSSPPMASSFTTRKGACCRESGKFPWGAERRLRYWTRSEEVVGAIGPSLRKVSISLTRRRSPTPP